MFVREKALLIKCLINVIFRAKITDLATEISRMQKEVDQFNQENATFLTYEKRYVYVHHTCIKGIIRQPWFKFIECTCT